MSEIWIETVDEADATGEVAGLYDQVRAESPGGQVPLIVKVLSLRPRFAAAKHAMMRSLLGDASSLGARKGDLINAVVSGLNDCRF